MKGNKSKNILKQLHCLVEKYCIMKGRKKRQNNVKYGDIVFERDSSSDFETRWSKHLTDRQLITATGSVESAIIFAAKEG